MVGHQSDVLTGDAVLEVVDSNDPFQSPERAGVVDLDTGDFVEWVSDLAFESPLPWSPDGELVLWTDGGELTVYDRTDGTTTAIDGEPFPFIAFAVEPTGDGGQVSRPG
jgi:hypothetical protein